MGPVSLNKDNLVNKAGVEVEVIPIMRSPCPSPKRKKKSKRAKSEMGFYKDKRIVEDDRGSLPDLKFSPLKCSLVSTVIQMNPETFLSNESLPSGDHKMSRSLGSTESLPKGSITNAVVSWLQKSSPFSSTDNIDHQSITTSIPDTMDVSMSIFDEDDMLETSGAFSEKSHGKSEHVIPDILVSDEVSSSVQQKITIPDLGNYALVRTCRPEVTGPDMFDTFICMVSFTHILHPDTTFAQANFGFYYLSVPFCFLFVFDFVDIIRCVSPLIQTVSVKTFGDSKLPTKCLYVKTAFLPIRNLLPNCYSTASPANI